MKGHALLLFWLLVMLVPVPVSQTNHAPMIKSISVSVYVPHAGISISGNDDFANQVSSEGWLGNGSPSNPYVIESLNITGSEISVSINRVSASFVIANCELATTSQTSPCFSLNLTSNGRIEGCVMRSTNRGIDFYHANNCILDLNTVEAYTNALLVFDCLNCTFTNNVFQNGGVELWSENDIGYRHAFVNNTVHGRQLGYFWNVTGGIFDASSFAQLIVIGSRNLVFRSGQFWGTPCGSLFVACKICTLYQSSVYNNTFGIVVTNCSSSSFFSINMTILNNNIFGNEQGMLVSGTLYGRVVGNTIYSNLAYGILLTSASHTQVYGNSFSNNGVANAIDNGWASSWDDGVDTGNQWSDYSGYGVYQIPGSAGSVDHYPRLTYANTTNGIIDGLLGSDLALAIWFSLSIAVVAMPVFFMVRTRRSPS